MTYSQLREEKNTKKIPLSRGKFALVDKEDYEDLSQFPWFFHPYRDTGYAKRSEYISSKPRVYINQSMHRRIMNAPESKVVDHINGNGLDNRKSNLRVVTHRLNSQNTVKHRENPFKLGTRQIKNGKYLGVIALGPFSTQKEAHEAYKEALAVLPKYLFSDFRPKE